ncbi:DUF2513 domain-containing protein [Burkholderia pseudomallei]|uniref:DUF2513 domain-containing protein n=1 Tax=Burkholderia pseudomallei TaxID=28450 RepID=UPI000A1A0DD2|nr:DUF2513 domain-containing protein [Burkholderia pseudomallei]ARL86692.1 hypothetical protein BOC57_11275 [Burkholderia pseudomallei]
MKRDMDLIRELMLKLESLPMEYGDNIHIAPDNSAVQVEGYSFDEIAYHLDLIVRAGFTERSVSHPAIGFMFRGLSWSGHDFLDSVRSPDVWSNAKQVASAAGGFTVDLLVFAAKSYLEGKIKGLLNG